MTLFRIFDAGTHGPLHHDERQSAGFTIAVMPPQSFPGLSRRPHAFQRFRSSTRRSGFAIWALLILLASGESSTVAQTAPKPAPPASPQDSIESVSELIIQLNSPLHPDEARKALVKIGKPAVVPLIDLMTRAVSQQSESRGDSPIDFVVIQGLRREKEAAEMALSDDLRERVVNAVVECGLSRNQAAKRFGVSIASAVRWVARFHA